MNKKHQKGTEVNAIDFDNNQFAKLRQDCSDFVIELFNRKVLIEIQPSSHEIWLNPAVNEIATFGVSMKIYYVCLAYCLFTNETEEPNFGVVIWCSWHC